MCVDVTQALPSYDSLNASIYVVQAGFQDYFFPLYDKKATAQSLLDKVQSVVSAITELIDVSLFSVWTLSPNDKLHYTPALTWHSNWCALFMTVSCSVKCHVARHSLHVTSSLVITP